MLPAGMGQEAQEQQDKEIVVELVMLHLPMVAAEVVVPEL
jgi:hypothetical protein